MFYNRLEFSRSKDAKKERKGLSSNFISKQENPRNLIKIRKIDILPSPTSVDPDVQLVLRTARSLAHGEGKAGIDLILFSLYFKF